MVEGRRDELAFVQKAEAHCHRQPLLKWAAEERGLPVSELPEHAAWLAEGAALEEAGRRMRETPGLRRADRGRARADRAGLPARRGGEVPRSGRAPRGGGAETGDRSRQHGGGGAAGPAGGGAGAPRAARSRPPDGGGVDLGTRSACPGKGASAAPGSRGGRPPDRGGSCGTAGIAWRRPRLRPKRWTSRIDAAEVLRDEGLRLLGEGEGAKLDDPARIRLSRAADERERVREAVDALGAEVQGLRSRAFVELSRSVAPHGLEAHPDPVDLPAWGALRDRAEALRGEAGLAPEAREAVAAVLARDARVEAEIAPVRAFLEEGALHLDRRAALDEGVRGLAPPSPDAIPDWRERSQGLRETALNLLGESPADTRETQAAARLADMPRLQGRVREVLDRAGDPGTARRGRGLPKTCGHGQEASQAAGNAAAVRRGLPPDNRDGADPREPRGLAGSGRP